tara:strand:- start:6071 stop:6289 length:219 start_codon:yes stop_codon:yes gene_type:complete
VTVVSSATLGMLAAEQVIGGGGGGLGFAGADGCGGDGGGLLTPVPCTFCISLTGVSTLLRSLNGLQMYVFAG